MAEPVREITTEQVRDWMGIDRITGDDPHLARVVPAVNAYINRLPSIDRTSDGSWAATTRLGAIMLAGRWFRRKNSPDGISSIGEVTTYISRWDSDIARLLNIDSFTAPVVG